MNPMSTGPMTMLKTIDQSARRSRSESVISFRQTMNA
jgi:hypothetical protein